MSLFILNRFNIALVSVLTAYFSVRPANGSEQAFPGSGATIAGLRHEDRCVISLFIYVPLTYYFIECGITVYSDKLYSSGPAVAESYVKRYYLSRLQRSLNSI